MLPGKAVRGRGAAGAFLAAVVQRTPVGEVMAQNNPLASQWRQDRAREESREGQRISMREVTARVSAGRLYSAAELISRAADLCSDSAGLVRDNERRWRTFKERVSDLVAQTAPDGDR